MLWIFQTLLFCGQLGDLFCLTVSGIYREKLFLLIKITDMLAVINDLKATQSWIQMQKKSFIFFHSGYFYREKTTITVSVK